MKFRTTILTITTALFFISCGDNTLQPITSDIQKIEIDQEEIYSIYATDEIKLSSSVIYLDGSSADSTHSVTWGNSDYNITTLNNNLLIPIINSGSSEISINYENLSDTIIVNVVGLATNNSWKITTETINTTTDSLPLTADGNFSDGTLNKEIVHNISWSSSNTDDIITINDDYSWSINISTIGDRNITATLFDVNKTISYHIE